MDARIRQSSFPICFHFLAREDSNCFKILLLLSKPCRAHGSMASMKHAAGPASLKLSEFPLKNQNMENNMPISSVNARVEKVNSVYGIVQATAFT